MSSILESETYIDKCSNFFLQRMGGLAKSGNVFDLGNWLQMQVLFFRDSSEAVLIRSRYACDVIGELYFGKQFGFMGLDYRTYIESLDILFPIVTLCCVAPSYLRWLLLLFTTLNPTARKAARGYGKIVLAVKNRVAERRYQLEQGKSIQKDILAKLFDIRKNKDVEDFQIPEIEQEAWLAMYVDPL
jgi:hypothetical protein